MALRPKLKHRYGYIFRDNNLRGCPELLIVATQCASAADPDPRRLLTCLSTLPKRPQPVPGLLAEPASERRLIRRRLELLGSDIRRRRAYRDLLEEVWDVARPEWQRRGRAVVSEASAIWKRRLTSTVTARAVVGLMPPRHPLTRHDERFVARLLRVRPRFAVVPVYFCMSGGQLADLDEHLHIGVPASPLEPARRTRDAEFVADRIRNLAEPTRVHILIYLMSRPSGVMQLTRALGMTQPTVSEHVRRLVAAGLVRPVRAGGRAIYAASPHSLDRLLEDARATVRRWL
jgi:ArsR family transcriptional regulator